MKKIIGILLAVTLIGALVGCSRSASNNTSAAEQAELKTSEENESNPVTENNGSNSLVVYFSLAGEQYGVGVIEEGNTAIIAKMIAEETGSDMFEIEAEKPYPSSQSELLTVAQNEQRNNDRPAYVGDVENFEQYETIYIGFPNWWGDMPMIVYNFLEQHDFSEKTVIPFVTHGGSGFSNTEKTIADITGASMEKGLAIAGTTAQNDRDSAREAVMDWLNK